MANFEAAIERTLKVEGGFNEDPQDPGGATNWGISRRWALSAGLADLDIKNLTREHASVLYRKYWWDEYLYGQITNQRIAEEIFDMSVVSGPHASHLCLQRALWSCAVVYGRLDLKVKCDGVLGPVSRSNIETVCKLEGGGNSLLAALKSEQAGYFRDLDKPRFEAGWETRAYA